MPPARPTQPDRHTSPGTMPWPSPNIRAPAPSPVSTTTTQPTMHAVPTSAESLITRILPDTTPPYFIPPITRLTPPQASFLSTGFSALPPSLDPTGTPARDAHNATRYTRKRGHITSILRHLLPLLGGIDNGGDRERRLVDACCGTGHVGLVLAYLLPDWQVVLLDRSQRALSLARGRAEAAGLSNVHFVQGTIEDYADAFEALVALHACGGASDACLSRVVSARAVGCVVPCCTGGSVTLKGRVTGRAYGAVVRDPHPRGGDVDWGRARSDRFRTMLGVEEYDELSRCADGIRGLGAVAKALLECDRVEWVRECGAGAWLGKAGGGVKDDIIVVSAHSHEMGDAGWKRDLVAQGAAQDFFCEQVDAVREILRECVLGRDEEYVARGGRRVRKAVHAAAEGLGLRHWSEGRGAQRYVTVARRKPLEHQPETERERESNSARAPVGGGLDSTEHMGKLFYRGYVGISAGAIDELAKKLEEHVPRECVERKCAVRGTECHITVFNAREVRVLGGREVLLSEAQQRLSGSEVTVLGVGRARRGGWGAVDEGGGGWDGGGVDGCESGDGGADGGADEAFFIVLSWPALQSLRCSYGLPASDAHVTLGFRTTDIHDVRKDAATIFSPHESSFTLWCAH